MRRTEAVIDALADDADAVCGIVLQHCGHVMNLPERLNKKFGGNPNLPGPPPEINT